MVVCRTCLLSHHLAELSSIILGFSLYGIPLVTYHAHSHNTDTKSACQFILLTNSQGFGWQMGSRACMHLWSDLTQAPPKTASVQCTTCMPPICLLAWSVPTTQLAYVNADFGWWTLQLLGIITVQVATSPGCHTMALHAHAATKAEYHDPNPVWSHYSQDAIWWYSF